MPTLAKIAPLQQTLATILAGEPRSHQALTVVRILAPMQAEPAWLTLAEGGDRARWAAPALRSERAAVRSVGHEGGPSPPPEPLPAIR